MIVATSSGARASPAVRRARESSRAPAVPCRPPARSSCTRAPRRSRRSIVMTYSSAGQRSRISRIFASWSGVGDEHRPRAGVVQERGDLRGGQSRIDRDRPGARAEDRVVGHRPLGAVLREDRDAVSGLQTQTVQPERERPDREAEVLRGDLAPLAADLRDEQIRICPTPPPRAKMSQSVRISVAIRPPAESRKTIVSRALRGVKERRRAPAASLLSSASWRLPSC